MQGYDASSYGDAFADVYDDWYHGDLRRRPHGRRAARPRRRRSRARARRRHRAAGGAARRGRAHRRRDGVRHRRQRGDAGAARVARPRRARDRRSTATCATTFPTGPFGLVFAAYNTLFNLTDEGGQARCFADVARRLRPGGRFVIEAFVPDDPPRRGDSVTVRSIAADRVVLSISVADPDHQSACGTVRRAHRDRWRAPAAVVDPLLHPGPARRVRACGRVSARATLGIVRAHAVRRRVHTARQRLPTPDVIVVTYQ